MNIEGSGRFDRDEMSTAFIYIHGVYCHDVGFMPLWEVLMHLRNIRRRPTKVFSSMRVSTGPI